jgi:ATP phosphoribosyltransferase
LLDAIDGVKRSEGLLHLEVVGGPASPGPGPQTATAVADYLRAQGAQHLVRGNVWDGEGNPGWRVTALLPSRKLTACHRPLFTLGASRIVGLPAEFVFERDAVSTFDGLRQRLGRADVR